MMEIKISNGSEEHLYEIQPGNTIYDIRTSLVVMIMCEEFILERLSNRLWEYPIIHKQ